MDFEKVLFFKEPGVKSNGVILRSTLIINSLDLGVLTPREYRFVARRTRRGDALVACHIRKLFDGFNRIAAEEENLLCVTFPVYARTLLSGEAADLLFNAFAKYPHVPADKVCVELSADILYEDIGTVSEKLKEIKNLGVRVAMFELGDQFCPVFRVARLCPDFAFVDRGWAELPEGDEGGSAAQGLVQLLHSMKVKAFSAVGSDEKLSERAKAAGFDGYFQSKFYGIPDDEDDEPEVESLEQSAEGGDRL